MNGRTMLVALAAALLVAAQVASATLLTTAQLHAEVAENLKGFSVQCGADLAKVYGDSKVQAVMKGIAEAQQAEAGMIDEACKATAFPCNTAFGEGTCCSFEGPTMWAKHLDLITELQTAGAAMSPGSVAVSSAIIILEPAANEVVTLVESFISPFYTPTTCVNKADAFAFNMAATEACLKIGPQILDCGMQWS